MRYACNEKSLFKILTSHARAYKSIRGLKPWPAPLNEMDDCILILIIDSDACAANIFSLYLGLNGYRTKVANLGYTGRQLTELFRPEVIFCNLNLPDMEGHENAPEITASTTFCFMSTSKSR